MWCVVCVYRECNFNDDPSGFDLASLFGNMVLSLLLLMWLLVLLSLLLLLFRMFGIWQADSKYMVPSCIYCMVLYLSSTSRRQMG